MSEHHDKNSFNPILKWLENDAKICTCKPGFKTVHTVSLMILTSKHQGADLYKFKLKDISNGVMTWMDEWNG